MQRALFGRKIPELATLRAITGEAIRSGKKGERYTVIREVVLGDTEFMNFAGDFLEEQSWLEAGDGGITAAGEMRCVRVVNKATGDTVLVNTGGCGYPRYTALEI